MPERPELRIFVATRADEVPPSARPFCSVDGSVPGASWTWDHHQSAEPINLDAMPETIDTEAMAGIATTMPDCDALASVVAVLAGGEDNLPAGARGILRAASYHCDHLRGDPDGTPEANRAGAGLNRFVSAAISAASPASRGAAFAALCRGVLHAVIHGEPLPEAPPPDGPRIASALRTLGRLRRSGDLVVVDRRGLPQDWSESPAVAYEAEPTARVGVWIDDHPAGGPRYTVGAAPEGGPRDLRPMLRLLARREFERGPPCLEAEPAPGAENWGGRQRVFGSPWNYGSRLVEADLEAAWAATRGDCPAGPEG